MLFLCLFFEQSMGQGMETHTRRQQYLKTGKLWTSPYIQVGFKGVGFKLQLLQVKWRKGHSEPAYLKRAKAQEAEPQYLNSKMQQLDKFYSEERLFS